MEQELNSKPVTDTDGLLRDRWLAECFHLDDNGEPLWPRESYVPFGEWLAMLS